jgi:hypothetical protein
MSYQMESIEYIISFYDGTHATPLGASVTIEGDEVTGTVGGRVTSRQWAAMQPDIATLVKQLNVSSIDWYVEVELPDSWDREYGNIYKLVPVVEYLGVGYDVASYQAD